jgi:hypothetical protein
MYIGLSAGESKEPLSERKQAKKENAGVSAESRQGAASSGIGAKIKCRFQGRGKAVSSLDDGDDAAVAIFSGAKGMVHGRRREK